MPKSVIKIEDSRTDSIAVGPCKHDGKHLMVSVDNDGAGVGICLDEQEAGTFGTHYEQQLAIVFQTILRRRVMADLLARGQSHHLLEIQRLAIASRTHDGGQIDENMQGILAICEKLASGGN